MADPVIERPYYNLETFLLDPEYYKTNKNFFTNKIKNMYTIYIIIHYYHTPI